jgi:peptidylprolyl isomerase
MDKKTAAALAVVAALGLAWWLTGSRVAPAPEGGGAPATSTAATTTAPTVTATSTAANPEPMNETTRVRLTTSAGDIVLELYTGQTPITAGNFIELAKKGYYDGTKFHRVIDGFMIQGGDPLTKDDAAAARWGTGGPGYTIEDEFVAGLSNVRGTIAMANTGAPKTGGSQFFINLVDNVGLDFDKPPMTSSHPVFGRVVEGLDVVDEIAQVATDGRDRPVEAVVIQKVAVE